MRPVRQDSLPRILTGDVTAPTTGVATITNDVVVLAMLQNIATATFLGRTTAGTGDPEALTAAEATALLNVFSSTLKGLVPASGGGTVKFLDADAGWIAPGYTGTMCHLGTGADGALNYDGAATVLGVAPAAAAADHDYQGIGRSGQYYVLTRSIYPSSMTVATGVTVRTNGHKVYCSGTLTLAGSAYLCDNGLGAELHNAGTGTRAAAAYPTWANGGTGAVGSSNGSTGGTSNYIPAPPYGATLASTPQGTNAAGGIYQGGCGGGAGANIGGGNSSVTEVADTIPVNPFRSPLLASFSVNTQSYGSGGGGGACVGGGTTKGGGGGSGGGCCYVSALTLAGTGSILTTGGRGANGSGAGGAGWGGAGGGGGGGGSTIVIYGTNTGVTISALGGGPGTGTGAGGNGYAGGNGHVFLYNISGDGT